MLTMRICFWYILGLIIVKSSTMIPSNFMQTTSFMSACLNSSGVWKVANSHYSFARKVHDRSKDSMATIGELASSLCVVPWYCSTSLGVALFHSLLGSMTTQSCSCCFSLSTVSTPTLLNGLTPLFILCSDLAMALRVMCRRPWSLGQHGRCTFRS